MQKLSEVIQVIESNKDNFEFLKTGFASLDDKLDGGFLRKELVVIGGQTGIGKSYLAGQILLNIAKQGFKTGYFSLEISNEMLVSRLIGALANLKPTRIRAGLLTLEEFNLKKEAKEKLTAFDEYMYFFDQDYELKKISEYIRELKLEFVVIDFIQNIITSGIDEYSRLTSAALELQRLSKECNCCILILSQLSNTAARESQNSRILEYKGSGGIAMVSDLAFIIERSDYTMEKQIESVKLNLRKNRRGMSHIYFDLNFKHPGGWIYESES